MVWAKVILLAFLASVYPSKAQTPEVVLYGEALCPYTIAAVTDVIGPLFDGGLAGRFTFRYVAYGNARTSSVRSASACYTCTAGRGGCSLQGTVAGAQAYKPPGAVHVPQITSPSCDNLKPTCGQ